jgi:hypothetical protein
MSILGRHVGIIHIQNTFDEKTPWNETGESELRRYHKNFMKIYQLIQKLLVKDTDSIVILYASLSFLREVS